MPAPPRRVFPDFEETHWASGRRGARRAALCLFLPPGGRTRGFGAPGSLYSRDRVSSCSVVRKTQAAPASTEPSLFSPHRPDAAHG